MPSEMWTKIGKLRHVNADDLELLRSWRNNPLVRQNMYSQHEIDQFEHVSWWESSHSREDRKYFIYEYDEKPLAVCYFVDIDRVHNHAMFGLYTTPFAPRGAGSRMEALALEYAFKTIALHKVSCEVLDYNTRGIEIHKRLGFITEGVFRSQKLINGTYVDVCRLGLLREEWEGSRDHILHSLISKLG